MDPIKKDYQVDNSGKPVNERTLLTPCYFRLRIPRTQWLYKPNDDFGSDLKLLKKNSTAGNSTNLQDIAERALEPLIIDGRADDISATLTEKSRHGAGLDIAVQDARGEEEETFFLPIR